MKKISLLLIGVLVLGLIFWGKSRKPTEQILPVKITYPLQIAEMRKKDYPGSDVVVEQKLPNGVNYKRYIASYKSEGLKIYGLLTVPTGKVSTGGWPIIIFNHGYIPPDVYKTTERYVAYVDGFARSGYVVFKPDYRGHGESEGSPEGAYYSPSYTIDVLNALASIKRLPYVNKDKIGMWGHSMGGHITLRSMVIDKDIKAGVIWGGVVASYKDMAEGWRRVRPWQPSLRESQNIRPARQQLIDTFGTFETNKEFWDSISPIAYISDISGPLELHHGLADEEVPWEFSESLKNALEKAGKTVEYYTYDGADHNLSGKAFNLAMSRSIAFFDRYLK